MFPCLFLTYEAQFSVIIRVEKHRISATHTHTLRSLTALAHGAPRALRPADVAVRCFSMRDPVSRVFAFFGANGMRELEPRTLGFFPILTGNQRIKGNYLAILIGYSCTFATTRWSNLHVEWTISWL